MDGTSRITLAVFWVLVSVTSASVPVALEWRLKRLEERRCGPSPRVLTPVSDPRFTEAQSD